MTRSDDVSPTTAARHFLSGCVQAGLDHVILSPGSRSSPLAVACAHLPEMKRSLHLDERTAAFAALGQAKASGRPVALICTSGTAAANYLPAVAEAGQSNVPLLVITADRPPEHQGWGVGQSFDQLRLYGSHVRDFLLMPVGGDGGLDHALRAGHRSIRTVVDSRGPVHVNWPFRLPLEAPDDPSLTPDRLSAPAPPRPAPSGEAVAGLESLLESHRDAVIIAGPDAVSPGPAAEQRRNAIWGFAKERRVPILADVLSGLRGAPDDVPVIDAADLLVGAGAAPRPAMCIRLGNTPTAKSVRLWWETLDDIPFVLVDPWSRNHDPSHMATHVFRDDPGALLAALEANREPRSSDWPATWQHLGRRARAAAIETLDGWGAWTEAHIARDLVDLSPDTATVVASSSMPVRDLDTFGPAGRSIEVLSNRGIHGIDGVVSTAIGVSRARGDGHVTVLIGDVAVLHDIGGVLDAARQGTSLTLVIPHNDGGGIFSFLPIRDALDPVTYDELFHTPHETDFAFLAGHAAIQHQPIDADRLESALNGAATRGGVNLLVADVDTVDNVAAHRAVEANVAGALSR